MTDFWTKFHRVKGVVHVNKVSLTLSGKNFGDIAETLPAFALGIACRFLYDKSGKLTRMAIAMQRDVSKLEYYEGKEVFVHKDTDSTTFEVTTGIKTGGATIYLTTEAVMQVTVDRKARKVYLVVSVNGREAQHFAVGIPSSKTATLEYDGG